MTNKNKVVLNAQMVKFGMKTLKSVYAHNKRVFKL